MRWLRALASQMSLTTREDTSEVTAFSNWASLGHTLCYSLPVPPSLPYRLGSPVSGLPCSQLLAVPLGRCLYPMFSGLNRESGASCSMLPQHLLHSSSFINITGVAEKRKWAQRVPSEVGMTHASR